MRATLADHEQIAAAIAARRLRAAESAMPSTSTTPSSCWARDDGNRVGRPGRPSNVAAARAAAERCAAGSPAASVYLGGVINRTSLGVAALAAVHRFGISPAQLSVFVILQLGIYAAMQIPTGVLVDRFGSRRLLLTASGADRRGRPAVRVRAELPDRAARPGPARLRRRDDLHQRAALRRHQLLAAAASRRSSRSPACSASPPPCSRRCRCRCCCTAAGLAHHVHHHRRRSRCSPGSPSPA